jgi:hypothetical protein
VYEIRPGRRVVRREDNPAGATFENPGRQRDRCTTFSEATLFEQPLSALYTRPACSDSRSIRDRSAREHGGVLLRRPRLPRWRTRAARTWCALAGACLTRRARKPFAPIRQEARATAVT